ncbi:hypothetical protein K6Y31_05065 [Motilimonas cestriensis]|uniref:Uncharacterized protein n=1 Tax=Motilimonas cestriensis TaxID=2742685 RepID=A0ABS8W5D9_9GAMM|nr:hypothetical protein [Motilimonas cestriensis]MCE2594181.1 hypothetical protein [Motilimonas cestriensis]
MSESLPIQRVYHVIEPLDWRLFGDELVVFNPMDNGLHIMPAGLLPLISCFDSSHGVSSKALLETYRSLHLPDNSIASLDEVLNKWLALNLISCRAIH